MMTVIMLIMMLLVMVITRLLVTASTLLMLNMGLLVTDTMLVLLIMGLLMKPLMEMYISLLWGIRMSREILLSVLQSPHWPQWAFTMLMEPTIKILRIAMAMDLNMRFRLGIVDTILKSRSNSMIFLLPPH